MIDYKQLATGEPADVEATTDDSNGEMAALQEMIAECEFEIELPDECNADGKFQFVIPGSAVGEFSDTVWEIDDGLLDQRIEEWNQEAIQRVESEN